MLRQAFSLENLVSNLVFAAAALVIATIVRAALKVPLPYLIPGTIALFLLSVALWLHWSSWHLRRRSNAMLPATPSPPGFEDQLRQLITDEARTIRQLHEFTGYAIPLVEAATDSMVTAGTATSSINERGEVAFHAVDVSIVTPIEATFDARKQTAPKDGPPGPESDQPAP